MDDRDRDRLAITRRVGKAIATDERFRALPVVDSAGVRPLLIALPDDTVSGVLGLLARSHPEGVNLIVSVPHGQLAIVAIRRDQGSMDFGSLEGDCPIHVDSQVGMLLAYLMLRPGRAVRLKPVTSGFAAEMEPVAA